MMDGELEREVETILHHQRHYSIQYYRVKYIGYDQNIARWLEENDFNICTLCLSHVSKSHRVIGSSVLK